MKIGLYDTECSGLLVNSDVIQELAWGVFDIPSFRLLSCQSHLLFHYQKYDIHPSALATTGLDFDFVQKHGKIPEEVFERFLADMKDCDAVGGHNIIEFDDKITASNMRDVVSDELLKMFLDKLRIDTMTDCEYPSHMKSKALKYLALEHGYVMSNAHEAMADVFACAHVLKQYDFTRTLHIAKTPISLFHAYTDFHDTVGRELVYSAGFRWNKDRKRHEMKARRIHAENIQKKMGDYPVWCDDKPVFQPELPKNSLQAALAGITISAGDSGDAAQIDMLDRDGPFQSN